MRNEPERVVKEVDLDPRPTCVGRPKLGPVVGENTTDLLFLSLPLLTDVPETKKKNHRTKINPRNWFSGAHQRIYIFPINPVHFSVVFFFQKETILPLKSS